LRRLFGGSPETPDAPFAPSLPGVHQPSDAALIRRVLSGDRESYAVLVERYQAPLFRHALGMLGDADAAADVAQDTLIKAYTRLDSCHDPDRFAAWVFRILRNRCRDWLKNRRQHTVELRDEAHVAPDDPSRPLEDSELGAMLGEALSRLPETQREAFLMKHVEELSYEEMADRLGTGVSALKMRVMRAREALQTLLKDLV
jgi:RNA polymerase sigma-70 factor (ECF subfamily)